jgi:predicted MFS family arabinose efflux permease
MRSTNKQGKLSGGTTLLLATGAGLAVSGLYYNQPLLSLMGRDLAASPGTMGLVPTLTQLGYAVGILFLTLLGDWTDRRRVILIKGVLLVAALAAMAFVPNVSALLATSLILGLVATMTQDIVPAAATLSEPSRAGRAVGTVMTGLLLGILLSRVVSGFAGSLLGWRPVYLGAAGSIALFLVLAWKFLPSMPVAEPIGYGRLLGSLATLWKRHPRLRRAALAQGVLSLGFGAFWSTLAVMLHNRYGLGSDVAGAFGLAGAAGALGAPFAGRLADRKGPEFAVRIGAVLVATFFVFMFLTDLLPGRLPLVGLVVGAVGFDLGYQFCLIPHQTLVYGLDPSARSRLNALLFVGMFLGLSAGSALGSLLLAHFGWSAVLLLGAASGVATLVVRRGR